MQILFVRDRPVQTKSAFIRFAAVIRHAFFLTPIAVLALVSLPGPAAGSWGPEATQGLLAQQGHRGPMPAELGVPCKKKGK